MTPLDLLRALPATLRFLTRLPIPALPFEDAPHAAPSVERMAPSFPLAGALIGTVGAAVLAIAHAAGLGGFLSATLALATLAAITGGFHEDGLADMADGLGGSSPSRRLDIMKDSRLGSFGVLALIFAFALRLGALEGLTGAGIGTAAAGLIAASAVGRVGGLWLLFALPPARGNGPGNGLAGTAGRPSREAIGTAVIVALALAGLLTVPVCGLVDFVVALIATALAVLGVQKLAAHAFGGQTGDVAGAACLVAEIAFLLALLIFAAQS
ncbi:adenosylcobinamide-GDP ribazoletransferase [Bosea sp. 117]|uniref:adenosylcobinamide-GDP ribazoletransferase n=1 Tax=Bosea sp. 117 TaxID=1125973 RepID=UPI000494AC78|nr:adenosylcobinamide-GDP ribazoletransferase [Bosea sp. 117]